MSQKPDLKDHWHHIVGRAYLVTGGTRTSRKRVFKSLAKVYAGYHVRQIETDDPDTVAVVCSTNYTGDLKKNKEHPAMDIRKMDFEDFTTFLESKNPEEIHVEAAFVAANFGRKVVTQWPRFVKIETSQLDPIGIPEDF